MSTVKRETHNELIRKRRKKMKIKRNIFFFLIIVSVTVTLALKLPYFNVAKIKVINNKNVQVDEIIRLSNINIGNNIFYLNIKSSKENIKTNPYVLNVEIKRKYPSTIEIDVKERNAFYFNTSNNVFYVVDGNGIVLEQRKDILKMTLIKLDGFDYSKVQIGKAIDPENPRKVNAIKNISSVLLKNKSEFTPDRIDVSNILDIKVHFGNIYVKIGDDENFEKKINTAINILRKDELKGAKGYVDVSFNGNPVYFLEN